MSEQAQQTRHTHHLELGDNAYWLCLWTMVGVAALVLVGMLVWHDLREDELIAKSRDPIETRCALGLSSTVSQQCQVLLVAKREN